MNNYKIVASDLDGTLLDNKSQVSRENLAAINELSKKGINIVLSTGRSLSEIPSELKDNPDVRYIIYSNGSVILDKETKKRILNCIPNSIGRDIFDIINSYPTHVAYRTNGVCYVDAAFQSEEAFNYYNVCEAHRVVVRNYAVYLDDFKKQSYLADNIEAISVFFHNYDDKIACKKYFSQNKRLRVTEVSEYNLEFIDADAGKGNALHALCDMLGVAYCDTVSIGDSGNDSTITMAAGMGLAVSNAEESLKAIADETICSNEEHVMEYVLGHYFS